ncbi:hypothetical protein [Chryseolinea sp. H1M3-3]|uniref:hypothetical protein n=1 Tax=Chryseolinea sp. H1M3-3 TaxID=3034144 RepID=UPI0023EDFAD7|nr:hypothetical protein [Chryseolinea sp. H1M3-3]
MSFDPVLPLWLIILIGISLTLLFLWQENKKTHRFKGLRMVSVLIMIAAFTLILLKPLHQKEKSSNIILLTKGYSKKQVDSVLLNKVDFSLMHLKNVPPYNNSTPLLSNDLNQRSNEIQTVIGEGIPICDLDKMDNKHFEFVSNTLPEGIVELSIPKLTIANRKNTINGKFNNSQETIRLYLSGPGGKEDSLTLKGKGQHNFKLTFLPKQSGEFIYTLGVQDSVDRYQEDLPIHVSEEQKLKILFLQHYPSFETQTLKSFLARKHHSMVLRHQVSKNDFRYEYINHEPLSLTKITVEVLDDMDLVISDSESLSVLSPLEKQNLENAIQSGLGLLNLSYQAGKSLTNFFPFQTISTKNDTAAIRLHSKSFNFPISKSRVIENSLLIPIQKNKSGVLSGYTFAGAGKIGFQSLQETYTISLAGDSISYSELWTPLIERISRSVAQSSKIKIVPSFPYYEDEPIDLEVISLSESISIKADDVSIPLKEDMLIDNVWRGRTWAGKKGWHKFETSDGSTLHYYVSDTSNWKSLALANQLMENALANSYGKTAKSEIIKVWEPVPPLAFYLLFLFAAAFLWLAPKL